MSGLKSEITIASPRDDVRVTLPDGTILSGAINTSIEHLLQHALEQGLLTLPASMVAAVCNGHLRELSYQLTEDVTIRPITLAETDGGRIYRRSLVLLLTAAAQDIWPEIHISVDHAVPDGGFFCQVTQHAAPFTAEDVARLEDHMHSFVEADESITQRDIPMSEALALFRERGAMDKVRLFEQRSEKTISLYKLRNQENYYFGYMVPSTRYLSLFRLIHVEDGFILQYPITQDPTKLYPIQNYDKIQAVFRRTGQWLERLTLEDIGRLNSRVRQNTIQEVVLVAEALHEQHVANIATQISTAHAEGVRIVLIAGPSSSGKTTFAKRLAIQLLAHGLSPFTIEMDNYFLDREKTPLDEHGEYDFESLYALNRELLNADLLKLMAGQEVQLPKFNFILGKQEVGAMAQLSERQIMILEGIHGLNPDLLPDIPQENIFRIYVSALTQLNIDAHNRVPTTDLRLLRRTVRDARTRGYSASDTLSRWKSVRRGEKKNIFPYQENAQVMFNSAMPYELAALRFAAEPLLRQVEFGTAAHIEAKRLLSFLRWVHPLSQEQMALIPNTSLLREFIGGSILENYHPGSLN